MAEIDAPEISPYAGEIPYHFTCNYCGEENRKSHILLRGSEASEGKEECDRDEKRRARTAEVIRKKTAAYRAALLAGGLEKRKRLMRIPLESRCDHCGKDQVWNPGFGEKEYGNVSLTVISICAAALFTLGLIGSLVSGIVYLNTHILEESASPAAFFCFLGALAAGTVMCVLWWAVDRRLEKKYFDERFKDEPNSESGLPELDI